MSELSKNVTGEWIKATAAFGHTPQRIPVQMYVEGDDDVEFWKEAVKPYQTKFNISVVTNKAVNQTGGDGKAIILSMEGLCREKVVAVDADFDLLIDNYSLYTNMIRENSYVVNTTWHSIENILLQKTNYIGLVEDFSVASWDLYTYYLATVISKETSYPVKCYGKMISQYGVQKCANKNDFTEFESAYREDLSAALETHQNASKQIESKLEQLGYHKQDVWKLTRGHYLWNMIVKPQIVENFNNRVNQGIQAQRQAGNIVDKNQVMNNMGITGSVKNHVEHDFYYGDMSKVNVPEGTRAKLDVMFT